MSTIELQDQINQLEQRCLDMIANAEKEVRKLTDEENTQLNELKKELEEKRSQLKDLQDELSKNQNQKSNQTNRNSMEKFNLLATIAEVANNKPMNERALEVINAGSEQFKRSGLSPQGQIILPVSETRAAIVANDNTKDVDALNVLPAMRNKSVLGGLGATFLTGLVGDVVIPSYSGSNVTWEGEVADAKDGAGTFSGTKYSPKRLTAVVDISKQFLLQDSVGAETMLKEDIINALTEKLESTVLGSAAGSATQPAGLFNLVTPTASVTTYAKVVALESALEEAKVMGEIKFALSPSAKATMKTTQAFTGAGAGILNGSEMDGLAYDSTGAIPASHFALGKWSDFVVAQFGAIDLTIDSVSQAAAGKVRIVINAYFDAKPRRNESFVTAKTIA